MKKTVSRLTILALAMGITSLALAAGTDGTWTGYVTETHCGAKGASADHKDCAVKCVKEGAKWALYNPTDKTVVVLAGNDAMMAKMADMAGKKVTVKGSLDKDKKAITLASMEPAP